VACYSSWKPSISSPAAKVSCRRGAVGAVAFRSLNLVDHAGDWCLKLQEPRSVTAWAIQIPVRSLLSIVPLGQIRCGADRQLLRSAVRGERRASSASASSVLARRSIVTCPCSAPQRDRETVAPGTGVWTAELALQRSRTGNGTSTSVLWPFAVTHAGKQASSTRMYSTRCSFVARTSL
jgi:hypothetical protein